MTTLKNETTYNLLLKLFQTRVTKTLRTTTVKLVCSYQNV
jgi:hypothetical protein